MLSKELKPVEQSAMETSEKSSYASRNATILDTDCLLHIFSYLTISERFKAERVCRLWKEASQSGWTRFHTLHFQKSLWGLPEGAIVTDRILEAVLLRCGKNLRTIKLPVKPKKNVDIPLSVTKKSLENILISCPNLKTLDFGLRKISSSVLFEVARSLPNLEHLGVAVNDNTDSELSEVFTMLKKLKSVYLYWRYPANICKCLKDLPKNSIEELVICNCYGLSGSEKIQELFDSFISESPTFEKLQKLMIHFINHDIAAWSYNSLTESFKRLELHGCGLSRDQVFLNLKSLSNLQELQFNQNFGETDEFLIAISETCKKLVKVVLGDGGRLSITDKGLSALATNLNLQYLEISGLNNLYGTDLPKMHALKYFKSHICENISEDIYADMLLTAVADKRTFMLSVSYFDTPHYGNFPVINGSLLATARKIRQDRSNHFWVYQKLDYTYVPQMGKYMRQKNIFLDYQKDKIKPEEAPVHYVDL